jgi:hypothetical protein
MIHLNIYNISYGWNKGWESKCQFDFQPLKVGNHPKLRECRLCATYRWKYLNKGYNFVLDLNSIGGLNKTLLATKVAEVLILRISKPSTWES